MVEKAHFDVLGSDSNGDVLVEQFIDLYREGEIDLHEPGYCIDKYCQAPLEISGINKLEVNQYYSLKAKYFRISSNAEEVHHIFGCSQLSKQEAADQQAKDVKEVNQAVANGRTITIVTVASSRPASAPRNSKANSVGNQNHTISSRGTTVQNLGATRKNTTKSISSVGTLVDLYTDPNFDNDSPLRIRMKDQAGKLRVDGSRSLSDIFFDVDGSEKIPFDEFHIFFGAVKSSIFGAKSEQIALAFNTQSQFRIYSNKSGLNRLTTGRHVLTGLKKDKPVLYFEGLFHQNKSSKKIYAETFNQTFAISLYMRPQFD